MNKNSSKLKRKYVLIFSTAFASLLTIIYGCKKNFTASEQNSNDPEIKLAKNWYSNMYPLTIGDNMSKQTQSLNTTVDYSLLLKPNWERTIKYSRYDDNVLEIPVALKAGDKFGADLKNVTTNKIVYKKEYSRTSFLILNRGENYQAYVMTIYADSAYIKNDLSKLENNKYNKRDTDFTGAIFYFTPKGKFINAWFYQNGTISGQISGDITAQSAQSPTTNQTQAIKNNTSWTTVCTTWTNVVSFNGQTYYNEEPPTCVDYYVGDTGVMAGGGSFPGSGGGGTSTAPTSHPCNVPQPVKTNGSANKSINVVTRPGSGADPDDGGFPPPNGTNNPCANSNPGLVIINDPSITSNSKVNCVLSKLKTNNTAYNMFLANFMSSSKYNVTFKVKQFDASQTANAYTSYSLNNPNVIIYLNENYANTASVAEIARTEIHEMAHTFLAQLLISAGAPGNVVGNLNSDYQTLFLNYASHVDPSTGAFHNANNSSEQHEIMAMKLMTTITQGIRDFVEANTPSIKSNSLITNDVYMALAWQTLDKTDAYSMYMTVNGETKESQAAKINLLKQSTTNDCNN